MTWCQMQLHEAPVLFTDTIPMCSLPDAVSSFLVCNVSSCSKSEHAVLFAASAGGAFIELGRGVRVLDRTGAASPPKIICAPNRVLAQHCAVIMVDYTGSILCSDLFGSPALPILGSATTLLPATTVTAAATVTQAYWLPASAGQHSNLLIAVSSETHVFLYIVAAAAMMVGGRGMPASAPASEALSNLDEAALLADITESQRYSDLDFVYHCFINLLPE